jgi:hypothetical protein
MARATRANGPSYTDDELADPTPPIRYPRRAEIGFIDRPVVKEEEPSVGTDSSPSSKNESNSDDNSTPSLHKPAHTTESHSEAPEQEADSTAPTTDTDGLKTPSPRSARARKHAPARVRSTDDLDDFSDFD